MSIDIVRRLESWGRYKKRDIFGLGYPSETIESKIQRGEILGDGNKGGLKNNSVEFYSNEDDQKTDNVIRRLKHRHYREMEVIYRYFLFGHSRRRISDEMSLSRYNVDQHLERAKLKIMLD